MRRCPFYLIRPPPPFFAKFLPCILMKLRVHPMKKSAFFLLLTTTALYWFSLYTYPAFLSNYASQELQADPRMVGAIVSSYGLTQMLLRVPLGFASDRLRRRKPFLILGLSLSTLAAIGLYAARTAGWVLIARGTAGMAAASWVAFSVLYASYGTRKQDTRTIGTLSACMYCAQLLGTLSGGFLARAHGMQSAFLLAAIVGALGIVCSCLVADVPPATDPPNARALLTVAKDRTLLLHAGLTILLQIIMWGTLYGFTPNWAKEALGADSAQVALLSTVQLVPNILFSWLAGAHLAPKFGSRCISAIGFACMALCCLGMPFTQTFVQMLCLQTLCGIGVGCVAPLMMSMSIRNIPGDQRGMAMGLYQALYGIGMFVGPVLAGSLVQAFAESGAGLIAGYRANFFAMAGVGALAVMLVLRLCPRDPA